MQRRDFLKGCMVFTAASMFLPNFVSPLMADDEEFAKLYASITQGKTVVAGDGKIKLVMEEKPANAMKAQVEITVDYPMTSSDYISKIYVLAPKNKFSHAITASYTPKSGMAYLYTEMRVGFPQDVVILAETNKGQIFKITKNIKVEASGCGG
ncbi:MAG: thiosulfate oxidation carrier protein SoxY [Campylobacterales bacterium]|nr:thiosulfate oxidation carrier protein SoxY [Campylobacterales bacterium]